MPGNQWPEFVAEVETGGSARARLTPEAAELTPWHARYTLDVEAPTGAGTAVVVTLRIACVRAWYLSAARRLTPVESAVRPPFPVGRFVVVQAPEGFFQVRAPWGGHFELEKKGGAVGLRSVVVDRRRCGLVRWGANKLETAPRRMSLDVVWDRLGSPEECLWVEPYPGGAPAAICLTDHCDFDTAGGVQSLADLFERAGWLFTKSVFPRGEPKPGKNETGLDTPAYAMQIDRLCEQGTEIAFHGFGPRVDCPPPEECARRAQVMERYRPATWIDHGAGSYLFSRSARLPDGRPLVEFLSPMGIVNYWSYVDLWKNPFTDLCIWSRRRRWDIPAEAVAALSRGAAWKGMLHPMINLIGAEAAGQLRRRPMNGNSWMMAWQGLRMQPAMEGSLALYGADGAAYDCSSGPVRIFDTLLLNYPALQMAPPLIDRLCAGSGLLLAHTYLCRPQGRGGCLAAGNGRATVTPEWTAAVNYVAQKQHCGELATVSFAGLRRALEAAAGATLRREPWGWTIEAGGQGPLWVAGFRGGLGRLQVPAGSRAGVRLS